MFANLLIVKQKSILHLLGPFAAACALSFVNFGPNYDARILETREAWKRNDPRLMASRAHAALASAQTDAEKSCAYYWLAVAHNLQEKPEMGLDYINQSITYNPHDAASNSVKAFSLARLKKFEEALQAANQCAELDPSYAWCYAAMTKIHYDQGNIEGAISAQRTAQRLDPKSPELLETLQWLEAQ
jgi:tetratricopeptide (TPR) repeat protein